MCACVKEKTDRTGDTEPDKESERRGWRGDEETRRVIKKRRLHEFSHFIIMWLPHRLLITTLHIHTVIGYTWCDCCRPGIAGCNRQHCGLEVVIYWFYQCWPNKSLEVNTLLQYCREQNRQSKCKEKLFTQFCKHSFSCHCADQHCGHKVISSSLQKQFNISYDKCIFEITSYPLDQTNVTAQLFFLGNCRRLPAWSDSVVVGRRVEDVGRGERVRRSERERGEFEVEWVSGHAIFSIFCWRNTLL